MGNSSILYSAISALYNGNLYDCKDMMMTHTMYSLFPSMESLTYCRIEHSIEQATKILLGKNQPNWDSNVRPHEELSNDLTTVPSISQFSCDSHDFHQDHGILQMYS